MSKGDNIGEIISGIFGLGTSAASIGFGYLCVDSSSAEVLGSGGAVESSMACTQDSQPTLEIISDEPLGATIVAGSMSAVAGTGGSTPNPIIYIIRSEDQKVYSKTEQRAKQIYDTFNKQHVQEKKEGTTLICLNTETSRLMEEVLNAKTKKELILSIEELQKLLNNEKSDVLTRRRVK